MGILSSIGYASDVDVDEVPQWARALGGLDYGVHDATSWRVTADASGARTVQLDAGIGRGRGITDTSAGGEKLAIPNPASGTLFHLVYARRNITGAGSTIFGYSAGGTDPKAVIGARKTFETGTKTEDDQPLALAMVQKDSPAVTLTDLRCWQANGGAVAADELVLEYLNRVGTHLTIGTTTWVLQVGANGLADWRSYPRPLARAAEITNVSAGPTDQVSAAVAGYVAPAGTSRLTRIHFQGHLYGPTSGAFNVKLMVGATVVGIKNYRCGPPNDKVDVDVSLVVPLSGGTYTISAVTGAAPPGTAYDLQYIGQLTVEDIGPVS